MRFWRASHNAWPDESWGKKMQNKFCDHLANGKTANPPGHSPKVPKDQRYAYAEMERFPVFGHINPSASRCECCQRLKYFKV